MRSFFRSLLALIVLFCGLFPASLAYGGEDRSKESWEQAFSRRNYRLGITLTEFRAERFPDQRYFPGAFPVCSNDAKAANWKYAYSQVFGELKQARIVKCHYYFMSPLFNREESAEILAAEWGMLTDFYFVKPKGADDFFLYQIISKSEAPIFNQLLQA